MRSALTGLMLVICGSLPSPALSSGLGKLVTPETQERLGLEFDLAIEMEDHATLVSLTFPRRGKLKDVLGARLSIPTEDGQHFLVRAPLEMQPVEVCLQISAQLSPALAERAAIELIMERGRREFYYYVRLADFIDRGESEK